MLKSAIESLTKSNKIVIIMNDNDNANKKRASTSRSKPSTSSFKIEPLKCKSYEEDFNMDMIHLFELYGIDLSKVSILRINDFPDPNECERYLKEHHLGENKNIKYPMVFIHGIYLGSNEEIDLAHNEGFLFDLFKDTGLYPTTATTTHGLSSTVRTAKNLSAVSDHTDYDDEHATTVSSASGDLESETTTTSTSSRGADNIIADEEEYPQFDVDLWTVEKANRYSAAAATSTRQTRIITSLKSFKTSKYVNASDDEDEIIDPSWMSSLTTLNRNQFCKAYLDKIDCPRLKKASTKSLILQDKHDLTPPSEVLAKINKWLRKTKEIIESRNQEIANKKRVFS